MYIKITTRCNMSCEHCCYSATKDGEDMAIEMFKKILDKWHQEIDCGNGYVTLGGGEPTLHPKFWDFVELAWKYGRPWMVTNGSNKKDALLIAELAKKGYLHGVLSLDKWHDPISREVIDAFTEGLTHQDHGRFKCMISTTDPNDRREIRTVILPYAGGRAVQFEVSTKSCPCPGFQFVPSGDIYPCGCDDAPIIGTVDSGVKDIQYKYYSMHDGCYKKVNATYVGET